MVPIDYLAVAAAAILGIAIGYLWYGPLFGKIWIRLMGWSTEAIEAAKKKGMRKQYALQAVGSLVMAYVLAHALVFASDYLDVRGVAAGLQAGFWNWIGFIAPVLLGSVLWEGKPWKLYVLNAGYYLVVLLAMGVLLALW